MNTFDLERLLLAAWPARETTSLHGWTVLTDGGVTGRPNAVSPLAFHGKLGEAIAAVQSHYTARHMRPTFRIARGACAPVDLPEVLISHGWKPTQETLVMTAPLADALSRLPSVEGVVLSETCPPAVDAIIRETSASAVEYEERRGLALRTPHPRAFAMIGDSDNAQAIGLSVIVEGQAAVFLMRTHPAHRRKGLARRVLAGLLGWARNNGATGAFLQVEADNKPAVSLYEAAAFKSVYSYDYWREETIP
ncbi:MAG: GNAT family N-acetyltransferase [Hyphomonadaceae bacterium]|nr:MAG: acetyltransferase [Caulobacteraceae bacterium]MBT9447295.1 GNAT family N-acetyltransferase [Hyphomonadaceae bacterium]TPW08294.1 MAG: acetyltransferase [Alphaproteobacteria bacterium]